MTPQEEKTAAIKAISDEQIELILSTEKTVKRWKYRPSKRQSTATKRMFKMVALGFQLRNLQIRKGMIMMQPIAPAWFQGGLVVGEGDEILINKANEKVICPNINMKPMSKEAIERLLKAIKHTNT